MAISTATIWIVQNDSKSWTVSVVDSAGAAVDLTGYTAATFSVKAKFGAGEPVIAAKTLGSGTSIPSPESGGLVRVTLDPADLSGVTVPDGSSPLALVWDLYLVSSTGVGTTVVRGTIQVFASARA